jgi:Protein of unknown function (DUF993)
VILMASRALAASARSAGDYLDIYGYLLKQADRPVILHWLGEAFDPRLRGYWGSQDFGAAADTVIELISRPDGKVGGIKLSVLDSASEIALRRRHRGASRGGAARTGHRRPGRVRQDHEPDPCRSARRSSSRRPRATRPASRSWPG